MYSNTTSIDIDLRSKKDLFLKGVFQKCKIVVQALVW